MSIKNNMDFLKLNRALYFRKYKNPSISLDEQEIDLDNTPDKSLTIKMVGNIRGNTAGFMRLYPKLSNAALVEWALQFIGESSINSNDSYDTAIIRYILPEFISRLTGKRFEDITAEDILALDKKAVYIDGESTNRVLNGEPAVGDEVELFDINRGCIVATVTDINESAYYTESIGSRPCY